MTKIPATNGGRMNFLVINEDTERVDLEQAMALLRAKQRACQVQAMRDEIAADVDELLQLWSEWV